MSIDDEIAVAKQIFSKLRSGERDKLCDRLPDARKNKPGKTAEPVSTDVINNRVRFMTAADPQFTNRHWIIVRHMAEHGYFYDVACRKYLIKSKAKTIEVIAEELLTDFKKKYKSMDACKDLFGELNDYYARTELTFEKSLAHYAHLLGTAVRAAYYYAFQYEIYRRTHAHAKLPVSKFHMEAIDAIKANLITETLREQAAIEAVRDAKSRVDGDRLNNIVEYFRNLPAGITEADFATRAVMSERPRSSSIDRQPLSDRQPSGDTDGYVHVSAAE